MGEHRMTVEELVWKVFGGEVTKQVFLWGVPIKMETRLGELCEMSHADGWLYLYIQE